MVLAEDEYDVRLLPRDCAIGGRHESNDAHQTDDEFLHVPDFFDNCDYLGHLFLVVLQWSAAFERSPCYAFLVFLVFLV